VQKSFQIDPKNCYRILKNIYLTEFLLNLPTLKSRRQYLSVSYLHDIYHQRTSIMFDCYCKSNSISSTRSHHLSISPPQSTINSNSLLTQSFYGTLCHCTYSMTPTPNSFGIHCIIACVLINIFVCCIFEVVVFFLFNNTN